MRGPGAGLTQRTATVGAAAWIGRCTTCSGEDLEVAPRRAHHERVECARCAARPARPLLAVPDDPRDHTAGRHRLPDGSTVERGEDGEIIGVYVDESSWAVWEADRRRRVAKCRATRPARLADLEAKLAAAGLRPVVDRELGLLRADCPDCRASDGDGLWRPLAVIPRAGKVLVCCDACRIERVHG